MIKTIFFDIDGTLVSFNTHKVPQSAVDAIAKLRKKGVKLFIATGRHLKAINNLGNLQFDGYITLNGSYCFAGKDEVIYKHSIEKKDLESLLNYMDQYGEFPCIFVREHDMVINFINDRVKEVLDLLDFPQPPLGSLKEALDKDVFQLIAFFEKDQEDEVMQVLPGCDSTRWSPLFTDVVPKGSSKRVGIDKVLEHYGETLDETMAFGDGGNDIRMLEHVGVGIAMGNAEDDVKQSADYVTDSVDDDGIAKALVHFGMIE